MYRVTYDSGSGTDFLVTNKKTGRVRRFARSKKGLHWLDTRGDSGHKSDEKEGDIFITTVDDNKKGYTKAMYMRAAAARKLQHIIGLPSDKYMRQLLQKGLLTKCNLQPEDVVAAKEIFGPDEACLRGKTTRRTPQSVVTTTDIPVPVQIMTRHRNVVLSVNFMFVNQLPFLNTYSQSIRFITTKQMGMNQPQVVATISKVKRFYALRGFCIREIRVDRQFEPMRGEFADLQILLNTTSEAEHVGTIERLNRTLKERIWGIYTEMMRAFGRIPGVWVKELVHFVVCWLNNLPATDGVSETLSPKAILTGLAIDFTKHCLLEFGEFVHTHEDGDNSMASRTVEALALRPTGNRQGGHLFLSLHTGRVIAQRQWTAMPMSKRIQIVVKISARRHPATLEVRDGARNLVEDTTIKEDDSDTEDEDYDPRMDQEENSEVKSVGYEEQEEEDDVPLIFNQPGPNHDGQLTGVATNYDELKDSQTNKHQTNDNNEEQVVRVDLDNVDESEKRRLRKGRRSP